jgi:hypothetical protein
MADEPKEQQPSGVPAGDKPAGTAGCRTAETCRASATEASRAAADAAEQ